jgi:hypothetical protein
VIDLPLLSPRQAGLLAARRAGSKFASMRDCVLVLRAKPRYRDIDKKTNRMMTFPCPKQVTAPLRWLTSKPHILDSADLAPRADSLNSAF